MFITPVVRSQVLIVNKGQNNLISFLATSTFGTFEGTTSAIDGFIKWDNSLTNYSDFDFKVYLDSLNTGIGLRNTHMRDNYLETIKFPFAQFTGRITNQI